MLRMFEASVHRGRSMRPSERAQLASRGLCLAVVFAARVWRGDSLMLIGLPDGPMGRVCACVSGDSLEMFDNLRVILGHVVAF